MASSFSGTALIILSPALGYQFGSRSSSFCLILDFRLRSYIYQRLYSGRGRADVPASYAVPGPKVPFRASALALSFESVVQ
jgi:hypothetical protein